MWSSHRSGKERCFVSVQVKTWLSSDDGTTFNVTMNSSAYKDVTFLSVQKRVRCTNRRSPPCTHRGAARLMLTSTAVASCTSWWRTGQQSSNLRPRWLWTRWQHDARRRTASWRSGLVQRVFVCIHTAAVRLFWLNPDGLAHFRVKGPSV